jgi:hypothetical protein
MLRESNNFLFFIFNYFDIMMLKIILKNKKIIFIYFKIKIFLKNNYYHISKNLQKQTF